ncbi:FAD binding domain-containing protein [Chloroflexota bacterium]
MKPVTLEEACKLLPTLNREGKLLSGGQSLVPLLQQRLISPKYLIDLKGISEIDYIRENSDSLSIGAITTERAIETSTLIKSRFPLLAEAAHSIGAIQIRNWGTIGGNLAHADPDGDFGPALWALGAKVIITSINGQREIPLDKFFMNYFESAIESDEILSEVVIPYPPQRSGGIYHKEVIRAGGRGISSMAVMVTLNKNDEVKQAKIVLGCQSRVPIRAVQTEKLAVGRNLNANMKDLEEVIATEADPSVDVLGSIEYKAHLVKVIVRHALPEAIKRAKAT